MYIFSVNCKWSNWGSYSSCSKTCGGGTQSRSRSKTIIEANGGSCPGSSTMTKDCNTQNCPSKFLFWLCFTDLFTWKKCFTWNSLTNCNVVFLKENTIILFTYYDKVLLVQNCGNQNSLKDSPEFFIFAVNSSDDCWSIQKWQKSS